MKQHLFRTEADAESFQPLFAEVRALGLRAGWLDLSGPLAAVPEALEAAAAGGAFRAVSVGDHRVVAVKRTEGEAVIKDLLREHFAGCHLVVVRGQVEGPDVVPGKARYTLRSPDGTEHQWTAKALAGSLGKANVGKSRAKKKK